MISLDGTTKKLEFVTSSAASVDFGASWAEEDRSGATPDVIQGANEGNVAAAATTDIVAAPAANKKRLVRQMSWINRSTTVANTVTVQKDISATDRVQFVAQLEPGWQLHYSDQGWQVFDNLGRAVRTPVERVGYTGRPQTFHKSGTAADAVGYWYCTSKDGGFPGAWAPGTPGLAGRATDGTTAADNGCVPFQNPATGAMFLTGASLWSSTVHPHTFFDCLWVNSGIAVTTTTAQTINSVAFPARDVNGSVNGEGCEIGLLVVTATTNAAVNNTATVSYTNSAGTAGRTATLEAVVGMQIPATAVIGTLVWFKLAAGDKGVQSIQSITLAVSLGAGAVSLLVARKMPCVGTTVVGVGSSMPGVENPGIRLYNGTCLLHCYRASATTATVTGGSLTMMER